MALFVSFLSAENVVYYFGKDGGTVELQLDSNKRFFGVAHSGYADKRVKSVQADGRELEAIRELFTGIPFSKVASVQVWKGDTAQFIWDNLPR